MNHPSFNSRPGLASSCAALLAAAALVSHPGRAAAQDSGYKAKNRSVFSGTLVARDPFWPIGWKKDTTVETPVNQVEITGDEFVVTSILLSPPALAVINGKEYGEGQFIPVPGSGARAQVTAIQDGVVFLAYRGKTVMSALRRNEHLSTPPKDPVSDANGGPVEAAVTPR